MAPSPGFTVTSQGKPERPISWQQIIIISSETSSSLLRQLIGCCVVCGRGLSVVGVASQVTLLSELLVQDVSILVEAAVDASHFPVFTHPELLTHQADKTLVMGHQHHAALDKSHPPG